MARLRGKNKTVLTEEQTRSATYLNQLIIEWQQKDLIKRATVTNLDLARMISEHAGWKLSSVAIGTWRTGEAIPARKNAEAIARFFEAPLEKVLITFGHEPPMTFQSFYDTIDELSQKERWEEREVTLKSLKETLKPEWGDPETQNWRHQVAQTALTMPVRQATIRQTARILHLLVLADKDLTHQPKDKS